MNKDKLKALEEKIANLHLTLCSLDQMGELSETAMKNLSEMLDEVLTDVERMVQDENR